MIALSVLLFVLRLAAPAAAPLGFSMKVEGQTELGVTISGPEAELAAGPFSGSIAINGSASEMRVAGTVVHAGGQWRLAFVVRYADLPVDWVERFRQDGFTYRLRSASAGAREWSGTRAWKDVEIEGGREAMAEFLVLDGVSLTHVSLLSSEAQARLSLRNPFSFPLKIASTSYTLIADGREVGAGQTQGMILHPAQKNVLALPIEVDHAEFISAAGGALVSGGDVAVKIHGRLVLRFSGGDVVVPLSLSGNLSSGS
jgi:LEA14-like dessication related protein